MLKQIVAATNNPGKLAEFRAILAPLGIDVISMKEAGIHSEPEETGTTFEENARIKAQAASQAAGMPALADDSGLCIHALNNEPGIYSARYAKKMGSYPAAFEDVLKRLENEKDKSAHFTCVLVLAFPNGSKKVYQGRVDGKIVPPQKGDSGFGFDPIFMPDGFTQTFSELSESKKNSISHRGRAMQAFIDDFQNSF